MRILVGKVDSCLLLIRCKVIQSEVPQVPVFARILILLLYI